MIIIKISNKEGERIIELFKLGYSCNSISNIVGRSNDGVVSFLKRNGYDTKRKTIHTIFNDEEVKDMIQMYEKGYSIKKYFPNILALKRKKQFLNYYN